MTGKQTEPRNAMAETLNEVEIGGARFRCIGERWEAWVVLTGVGQWQLVLELPRSLRDALYAAMAAALPVPLPSPGERDG